MRHFDGRLGRLMPALGMLGLLLAALYPPAQAAAAQRSGDRETERMQAAASARKPEGPLQVIVSIDRQTLRVFDKNGLVATSTVSTGTGGRPTPTGIFSILDKNTTHFSNIYGSAPMPYMQRLTMSGVAMHSGVVTGRPASHGCIRLPHAFAIRLFGLTDLGGRAIVADDEVVPVPITHPRLFKPKLPQVATAEGLGAILPSMSEGAQGPAALGSSIAAELQYAAARAQMGSATADRETALLALPVSVFVSREAGRVYVRHAFLPLFDAPVEISGGERGIGTHVYTAIEPGEDGMRWTAVSIWQGAGASGASEALDRIELPPDVSERISRLITPGASLIVSDEGPSTREMRVGGTDFVILTK